MKRYKLLYVMVMSCVLNSSCQKEELVYNHGDLRIDIRTGDKWLHDFDLFLGLEKKNPPQFAVWLEDTAGHYLTTVFATYKIASEGWQANKGNRRKEALPHWSYQRGVIYDDGLMLPTKEHPLTDGITGATPKKDKVIQVRLADYEVPVVIKAEFNHSTDFNVFFPEDAREGDPGYSGGKGGSGQPALVYQGILYPGELYLELECIGHSSPDGSSGLVQADLHKLTSALEIVDKIIIKRN